MDATQGNDTLPELTPEQLAANAAANAQDDDDFLAAFNETAGASSTSEGSTSSTTTSATAAAATTTQDGTPDDDDLEDEPGTGTVPANPGATATPAEDDLDAPVAITKRQLDEMTSAMQNVAALQAELRKHSDSTNGRFGSIQQTLKEVREQAGKGVRPSFNQLKAMEEAFPELAEVLKQDLAAIYGEGNETQGTGNDPTVSGADAPGAAAVTNPLELPEVRAALRERELAIVDATHAGWRQLPATADWKTWQEQLPQEAQRLLATTSNAAVLNDAIADFKEYQQKQAAAASVSNQRDNRLARAIPATTGSAPAHRAVPSDDDEFTAGFQSVVGRR